MWPFRRKPEPKPRSLPYVAAKVLADKLYARRKRLGELLVTVSAELHFLTLRQNTPTEVRKSLEYADVDDVELEHRVRQALADVFVKMYDAKNV